MTVHASADLRAAGAVAVAGALALSWLAPPGPLCPLRRLTGVPCPLCGTTAGVLATVDGRLGDALAANPAAPLFVLAAALAWAAWGLRRLGVRVPSPPAGLLDRAARVVPVPALAGLWVFELHRFGVV